MERSRAKKPLFYIAPTPPNMHPMQFQLAGVEYAVARPHCLFGDAPGLGKSAECIMVSNAIEAKKTLVVCPASLRLNWEREIWAWSTQENVTTYPILKAKDGVDIGADYVIVSYALLANKNIREAIMDTTWDNLVLDEAHAMKDPNGNTRTRAICGYYDGRDFNEGIENVCGRITMASGTILPNQPIECYNAVRLMNWDAIDRMSLEDFREYYYRKGRGYVTGPYIAKFKNKLGEYEEVQRHGRHMSNNVRNIPIRLKDLQFRLRKHVMVRRLTEHVLPQLPQIRWKPVPLLQDAGIRKALSHPGWVEAEKLYQMDEGAFSSGAPIDGSISTARRELGEAKAPAIADYIHELIRSGTNKIIVSAWHHSVLDYLKQSLSEHGLVYMDGRTSATNKQKAVDMFQEHEGTKIILGQMITLMMGWTLIAARDVVNAEPDWVSGNNEQLMFRVRRIGQKADKLIGHMPLVPDTLDEHILSTVIKKDKNIYQALDAPI